MALPRLNVQRKTLELPVSKDTVEYRPFLVGEEKILLIAQETGKDKEIIKALVNVIKECTFGSVDATELAMIDFEFLFLHMRMLSKGEVSTVGIGCKNVDCKKTHDVDIDLTQYKLVNMDTDPKIFIEEEIGLMMRPPSVNVMLNVSNAKGDYEESMAVVKDCMYAIYDVENVTYVSDVSEKELMEFVESFTDKQFELVRAYIDAIPAMRYEVDHICPHCTTKQTSTIEGISNFF